MQVVTIQQWLTQTALALQAITDAAFEEASYILLHILQKDRAYLISHSQDCLEASAIAAANTLVQQRLTKKPLAYILQHTYFYGLKLFIDEHVLVPRNDTECLVEWVLQHFQDTPIKMIDLGTGSGAIACALKQERPHWQITATDICSDALAIAQQNATDLTLDITLLQSNWFDQVPQQTFDLIISNPPYIAKGDINVMPSVDLYEPQTALYADNNGLAAIEKILQQAHAYLYYTGIIVFEHGFAQKDAIHQLAKQYGYTNMSTHQDLNGLDRFTIIHY